jgi:antitoxin VapB
MTGKATAKLFMHGRSQAVRLPKEFRMEGTEVSVTRSGDAIMLSPIVSKSSKNWEDIYAELDAIGPTDDYPDGWRNQRMLPYGTKGKEV